MKKAIDKMTGIFDYVLGIILTIMLAITFVQVVMRYVFNSPFVWAAEVTLILLVWYGFLIVASLIRKNEHIALEFLYIRLSKKFQKALDLLKYLLLCIFAILMVYYGIEMIINTQGRVFPVTRVPRFLINIPMVISGLMIVLYTIENSVLLLQSERRKGI